ncbi:MAG: caspase family protein [Theionarchaea archaeon]|nr:caspase family protein [Theionarchaea archaeon]
MSENKKLWALVALVIVILGCLGQEEQPSTEISREEATETVIGQIAKSSEAPYGLRVYGYPDLLPKGSTIVPFAQWTRGEQEFISCDGDCWFFWLDYDPMAHFSHKTLYVLVSASTGEMTIKEAEWWPVVNGKEMWGKFIERASDEFLVYETEPEKIEAELVSIGLPELPPLRTHALPGCEAWAIIVCGSDDVTDTFDEDIKGIYNVLTGLEYADDHIFYVSPWTGDQGVDRVTNISNVQWAINQVAARSDSEDTVFFFYTSHGGVDSLDCNPGAPGGGTISSTNVDNWLDTITSRDMIILIEACHSGSFIGAYCDRIVAAENELTGDGETNRIVMTATDTLHSSYGDVDPLVDPNPGDTGSEFPGGYIEAFSTPDADLDGDGAISVGEAYQYAWDNDAARLSDQSCPQIDPTSLNASDVFHTCRGADVWISDGPNDSGNNSYDYSSIDIWSSVTPSGTSHENPVSGLTNYVHVRVHNLGSTPVTSVDVALYWADTSTATAWPGDFTQIGGTYTIPSITAGGSAEHTWSWYVDPAFGMGHHFCFVATAQCSEDPMTGGPGTYVAPFDNNIAQKNVTIVEGSAGHTAEARFFIENNMKETIPFDLIIDRSGFPEGELVLVFPADSVGIFLSQSTFLEGAELVERGGEEMLGLLIARQKEVAIRGIQLKPMERQEVTLEFTIPEEARIGQEFTVRVQEVVGDEIIGAVTFLIRVTSPGDCQSALKRTAEVFAQIAQEYESEAAARLVKLIDAGLREEICSNPEATMELKREIFELEVKVAHELEGHVPKEELEDYLRALDVLGAALDAGDLQKVMLAEESVIEAAMKLVTHRSMHVMVFGSFFYFLILFSCIN